MASVAPPLAPPTRAPVHLPRVTRADVPIFVGLTVVVGLFVAALVAPLPYDPIAPDANNVLQGPTADHWFGTDGTGYDVFSRVISSAKRDLPLAVGGTLLSLLVGVPLGLLASAKGKMGERIMRGLDIFQAFPLLVLAIAVVALTGNKIQNVIYAIAIVNVPRFMRLVRSEALHLREARFIEAATAIGCKRRRVMFRHLLPNVTGVLLVQSSLAAAHALIVIAALNFIGVGSSPPNPSWGSMIQLGSRTMATGQWWIAVFPGLAILLAVASLNMIADGLENRLHETGD